MLLFALMTCGLGCLCIPCCLDDFNSITTETNSTTQNNIVKSGSIKAAEVAYEHVKNNKTHVKRNNNNN